MFCPALRRSLRSTARNASGPSLWERGCHHIWGQNTSDRRWEVFSRISKVGLAGNGGVDPAVGMPKNNAGGRAPRPSLIR